MPKACFEKAHRPRAPFPYALSSTNIVFELGILIWVLLGWQFLVAEFVSGVLLVAVVYVISRATLPVRVFDAARRRLEQRDRSSGAMSIATAETGWQTKVREPDILYRFAVRYFKPMARIWKSVVAFSSRA